MALTAVANGLLETSSPLTDINLSPGASRPSAAAAPPVTTDRTTITELPGSDGS